MEKGDISSVSLWLGDQTSFMVSQDAKAWMLSNPEKLAESTPKFEEEDDLLEYLADAIYQVQENVAVITVSGAMTNEDSFWNLFFGMTSYNTISTALNRALEDSSVTDIILNVSTSGGDAEGIGEVGKNIRLADKLKPVWGYSATKALSAGYWIISSTRKIYGSEMAEFGSIGVVVTHTSRSRWLKEKGYDVTVFRGGEFKALGHPAEELSKKAKKLFQEKTDKIYNFFLEKVSQERKQLTVENKDAWAEGKVFFSEEAKALGMIDGVTTFGELVNSLITVENTEGGISGGSATVLTEDGDTEMKKVILSQEAVAALSAGADLNTLPHTEGEEEVKPEDSQEMAATDEEADDSSSEGTSEEVSSHSEGVQEVVSFLKSELKDARKELTDTAAELKAAKNEVKAAETGVSLLREVAIEAVEKMQIALGQTPIDLKEATPEMISQQYSTCKAAFNERFKVGQVSEPAKEDGNGNLKSEARRFGLMPVAQG